MVLRKENPWRVTGWQERCEGIAPPIIWTSSKEQSADWIRHDDLHWKAHHAERDGYFFLHLAFQRADKPFEAFVNSQRIVPTRIVTSVAMTSLPSCQIMRTTISKVAPV